MASQPPVSVPRPLICEPTPPRSVPRLRVWGIGAGLTGLAAVAVAYLTLLSPPVLATEQAVVTTAPAPAAAGWLARQMTDGEHFEHDLGGTRYPDQGLTIDAVLAFAAAGTAGEHADRALAWLAAPDILAGYVGDGETESYAGPHAKLMLAVQTQGGNPASFGGVDLATRLRSLMAGTGRFSDITAYGDLSNAFSQSFAILALDRTAEGVPVAAVGFLEGQQCDDGGFPLLFAQPTCTGDVDSTAMVVQALLAAGATGSASDGLDWLMAQQKPDGGFGGSGPTSGENANSTGLAAQALRVGGRDVQADQAVAYLVGLQVGCTEPEANRGGVAYDDSGFDLGNAARATAQAVLGLAGKGLAELDGTTSAAQAPVLGCPATTATATATATASASSTTTATATPTASLTATPTASPTATPTASPTATVTSTEPAQTTTSSAAGGLPTTGERVGPVVLTGGVLLVAGALVLALARSHRRADDESTKPR